MGSEERAAKRRAGLEKKAAAHWPGAGRSRPLEAVYLLLADERIPVRSYRGSPAPRTNLEIARFRDSLPRPLAKVWELGASCGLPITKRGLSVTKPIKR